MATQTGMSTKHLEMHQYGSFGGGGVFCLVSLKIGVWH